MSDGISKYWVVVYVLATVGFTVIVLNAVTIGLEDIGPRVRRLRRGWAKFKRDLFK